jgi:sensor histidine kinase YesM
MLVKRIWLNNLWIRVLQHLVFWVLSYYVFLNVFKIGGKVEKIDYIYTALFHASILPAIYINLTFFLPRMKRAYRQWRYIPGFVVLIALFSWINYSFFGEWSNVVLPNYFFISYFTFWQVALFFVVYLSITTLLKLSKSWFIVNEIENELLITEKQKVEFELKALRAQMNPHFIFNCMNSIKSLIQQKEEDKAVNYLTTFSKLLRTILQNSDQKEISLFDEIETCRLYLQLETMRFGDKLTYAVNIEETVDLKSIQVPALIIQPFIENAIWHGIVPRERGGFVRVNVTKVDDNIEVIVDDDGIGRETSVKNKPTSSLAHQPKGMHLTQSRLDLENRLNEKNAHLLIIDKKDNNGQASGTRVVLTFAKY